MATLKISDLSVGDWVINHRGYPTKVQVITSDGNLLCGELDAKSEHCTHLWVQDIKPIPITAEILENNEVHKTYEDDDYAIFRGDGLWVVKYSDGDWELSTPPVCRVDIKYVHQLQHALRLSGVDKEINL